MSLCPCISLRDIPGHGIEMQARTASWDSLLPTELKENTLSTNRLIPVKLTQNAQDAQLINYPPTHYNLTVIYYMKGV